MTDLSKIPNSQLLEAAAAWRAHDLMPRWFGKPLTANASLHDRIDDLTAEVIRLRAELERVLARALNSHDDMIAAMKNVRDSGTYED